jgi:hypothetical protein
LILASNASNGTALGALVRVEDDSSEIYSVYNTPYTSTIDGTPYMLNGVSYLPVKLVNATAGVPSATAITTSGATFENKGHYVAPGFEYDSGSFRYSLKPDVSDSFPDIEWDEDSLPPSPTTAAVTGLTANTSYYLRSYLNAKATSNGSPLNALSAIRRFSTLPLITSATAQAAGLDPTDALIDADFYKNTDSPANNVPAKAVTIYWDETPLTDDLSGVSYAALTPGDDFNDSGFTAPYQINDLTPDSTYYLRIVLENQDGNKATKDLVYRAVSATTLTVSKIATGEYADRLKDFPFTVYFESGDSPLEVTGLSYTGGIVTTSAVAGAPDSSYLAGLPTETYVQGKVTFTLKHGQSIKIDGVPASADVRVAETSDGVTFGAAGYETSFRYFTDDDGEDSAIAKAGADTGLRAMDGDPKTVAFKNESNDVPPTGLPSAPDTSPLIIAAITALAVLLMTTRRIAVLARQRSAATLGRKETAETHKKPAETAGSKTATAAGYAKTQTTQDKKRTVHPCSTTDILKQTQITQGDAHR